MDIRIDRKSEIPIRQQLAEHVVYLIATEKLKPGQPLPSVRTLARQLKIHHNTVSQAYQDLVSRTWLVGKRGSRVVVRSPGKPGGNAPEGDLDDLINATHSRGAPTGILPARAARACEEAAARRASRSYPGG